MNAQTQARAAIAALPRVNLLPPEIEERKQLRRLQLAAGAAGLGAIVVVGALYSQAHHSVASAQSALAAAQQKQTVLQGQLTRYNDVEQVYQQVSAAKAQYVAAMGPEIQWSHYLNDLSLRVPNNVWLTSITATESGAAGGTAPVVSAQSLVPTGIGTVTFAGTAFTHDDVATWLETLAKEPGFTFPYFTNSTEGAIGSRSTVNFSSSVVLTPSAESGRAAATVGN